MSDGLGYDISVERAEKALHFEVKTTNRRGRLAIYLSRNEYEVMCADADWQLATVFLDEAGRLAAVGIVDRGWIAGSVPVDSSAYGRWESVRLKVPSTAVSPGIVEIQHWLRPQAATGVLESGSEGSAAPQWLGPTPSGVVPIPYLTTHEPAPDQPIRSPFF
ncbi:protein NO VEIN domain-containing protein [Streptomyces mirabilis]|uniref:protein NO VEIN domain-containing protein n=1 Tax=Streptomyces mirabilis TaxID=68239 RepID=UPI00368B02BE